MLDELHNIGSLEDKMTEYERLKAQSIEIEAKQEQKRIARMRAEGWHHDSDLVEGAEVREKCTWFDCADGLLSNPKDCPWCHGEGYISCPLTVREVLERVKEGK